ncbi:hypothetical protein SOVF_152310 [Spinacia oleracea]|nr:hypothetical protein SOVF_152310 [Spinacia oleracea]
MQGKGKKWKLWRRPLEELNTEQVFKTTPLVSDSPGVQNYAIVLLLEDFRLGFCLKGTKRVS